MLHCQANARLVVEPGARLLQSLLKVEGEAFKFRWAWSCRPVGFRDEFDGLQLDLHVKMWRRARCLGPGMVLFDQVACFHLSEVIKVEYIMFNSLTFILSVFKLGVFILVGQLR